MTLFLEVLKDLGKLLFACLLVGLIMLVYGIPMLVYRILTPRLRNTERD